MPSPLGWFADTAGPRPAHAALRRQADRPPPAPRPGPAAPVYEDPATSARQLSLDRADFTRLLHEAAVGDTICVPDAARLFRSVAAILPVRPVLIRRGLHVRVESGLLW
ncbi:recombinase family protein [Streptomyces goshikiensis]|uniref:recombinase family protein n=1 Tax=Streptomyces goshikiensis TaxID=1942 RepID=UPI0036CCB400